MAAPKILTDFVRGFVGDARPDDENLASAIGDTAGALNPARGLKDVFDGVREKDVGRLIGGLILLIPVGGSAFKAGEKVAGHVAKKGLTKTALQYQAVGKRALRKAMSDPAMRKQMEKKASEIGFAGLAGLVHRLQDMGAEDKLPDVSVRDHRGWIDARQAAEQGMGAKPGQGKGWFDLREPDDSGKDLVVGRHQVNADAESQCGLRWFVPNAEDEPMRLAWWKNPSNEDPTFGVESFATTSSEVDAIMKAYLMRNKSFRPR